MDGPEAFILRGDQAALAQDYDQARSFYTEAAHRWSVSAFYLKSLAVYQRVFELDMLDETMARKISVLYRTLGLDHDARTWAIWSRQIGSCRSDWIAEHAVAPLGHLDPSDGRGR